jgi:hypothetical protein
MNKRVIVFVMVAIMLFAVCTPPPAQAIVPAVAWVVWGIATGVGAVAVVADETSKHEEAKANHPGQDVNALGMKPLPHPTDYYQLGSPTPAGYVHGVEVADSPCVRC